MATELQQRCFVCGVHKEDIEEQLVLWETRCRFQHESSAVAAATTGGP